MSDDHDLGRVAGMHRARSTLEFQQVKSSDRLTVARKRSVACLLKRREPCFPKPKSGANFSASSPWGPIFTDAVFFWLLCGQPSWRVPSAAATDVFPRP